MKRKIIKIDEARCGGCGLCVSACHEGAIGMVNGKAMLLRDDYCDGLENCLPVCPAGAISFEEREAAAFNAAAAEQRYSPSNCRGAREKSTSREIPREETKKQAARAETHLAQWPVQIKLVPPDARCFQGANLLVAADCTAYACGNFHADYMKDRTTVIGCPKLDGIDYSEKIAAIFGLNDIQSITVTRMEVPCCGGIESAVRTALEKSGKPIPLTVVVLPV